ncbi:MAG TPA: hypothetical protein VMD59_04835 [Acidimicrobiales bacterium]|nr:hypothetical protein [Acidimicrobiales bacterium]
MVRAGVGPPDGSTSSASPATSTNAASTAIITTDGEQLAERIAPELANLLDAAALDIGTAVIVSRLRHNPH